MMCGILAQRREERSHMLTWASYIITPTIWLLKLSISRPSNDEKVCRCVGEGVRRCADAEVHVWRPSWCRESVEVRRCGDAEVWRCGGVRVRRGRGAEVPRYGDAAVWRCAGVRVRRCGHAKLWSWKCRDVEVPRRSSINFEIVQYRNSINFIKWVMFRVTENRPIPGFRYRRYLVLYSNEFQHSGRPF